jgi:hydrogenase-4 component E
MDILSEALLVFLVLTNMLLLGSSRIGVFIRVVALQGVVLALLFVIGHGGERSPALYLMAGAMLLIKGGIFPRILLRAVRETGSRREIEPFVGFNLSLLVGIAVWGLSIWLGQRLTLPTHGFSDLLVPVALFTTFVGLFLIISRKNAITQVLGYLVLENGIYVFGVALEGAQPLMVELGILLDIFAAVFIMVITLFQINREIGEIHMDTSKLAALKD